MKTMEVTEGTSTFFIDPGAVVADEALNGRRYSLGRVDEMMADIMENGQKQPVEVRDLGNGKYQLHFGFRRHKAISQINAEKLYKSENGPMKIWAIITTVDPKQAFLDNVSENVHRQDLTPIDKAYDAKKMIDEYQMSQDDAARRLDISKSYMSRLMGIINNTPAAVQKLVHKGEMQVETAYEISQMEPEAQKDFLAREANPDRKSAKKRKKKERGPKPLSGKAIVRTFEGIAEVDEDNAQTVPQMLAADIASFARGEMSEATIGKRLEKYCRSRI